MEKCNGTNGDKNGTRKENRNTVNTGPTIGFSSTSAPKRNSDAITSICVDSEDEDDGDQPKPCTFFFLFTSQIEF